MISLGPIGSAATVVYDSADAKVVQITAGLFAGDVQRVTGVLPVVTNSLVGVSNRIVLIGTIGHSSNLDALITNGKMDVSAIQAVGSAIKFKSSPIRFQMCRRRS